MKQTASNEGVGKQAQSGMNFTRKFHNRFWCLGVLWALSPLSQAKLPPSPFEATLAPDKHTIIYRGEEDCHFLDLRSHKNLGHIPHTTGNEGIIASWNSNSSKVAIVKLFGTRGSCFQIFRRTAKGTFEEVPFEAPQPMELHLKAKGALPFSYGASNSGANGVGPWLSRDTIHMIAGESHQSENPDPAASTDSPYLYQVILVTFDAQIKGKSVLVGNVQLHELMSEQQAEKFLPWSQSEHQ